MIEHGVNYGPAAGIVLYGLIRALREMSRPQPAQRAVVTPRRVLVTPPPGRSSAVSPVAPIPHSQASLPLAWPLPPGVNLVVPVERWVRKDELLAWRFWGLGRHTDGAVRLTSFRAPWAWDGPVLRAHRLPSESPFSSSGVYALKSVPRRREVVHWSEECWVTGWVALSGRVVEHEHGFRAERVVIRRLRLGVGTHLRVRKMEEVRALARELERRYQAPVNLGLLERRFVQRALQQEPRKADTWKEGIPTLPGEMRCG